MIASVIPPFLSRSDPLKSKAFVTNAVFVSVMVSVVNVIQGLTLLDSQEFAILKQYLKVP